MKFAVKTSANIDTDYWNVLIVDDEDDVHSVTKLVLKNFSYKDKKIKFYDAYNIDDTKKILASDVEFSLILLDIVMERNDAGLFLVKYIREELKNHLVRIILRTGEPGTTPEEKVIIDYDVNDYKEKTELTAIKLKSSIISSLRSFEELKKIRDNEKILKKKVEENIAELRKKDKLIQYQNRISENTKILNTLAHQWRQPLNIISLSASSLLADIELDCIDNEEFEHNISDIVQITQLLSNQIDSFLNHYKPNNEKEEFLLGTLFEKILDLVKKRVENHNIEIISDINTDLKLNTYKSELEQIIVHLIENSIDAYLTNENLPRLIKIKSEEKDNQIVIRIEDSAGGLSEEIKDKIFIPYFSTKEELNDTGLGLYMSKLLMEEHLNGKLNIFNNDKGCTAEVILY
ncbi:MAG: hypothetical protein C0625_05000 [Arcobacter sp.]|mgnify:CR=1 FL=1|nr:MAG: hypothetical protein C0625_05000 [Arcobacter sp.]